MSNNQPIVLMYHGIIGHIPRVPAGREEGADIYDVGVQKFREQMQYLKEHGYKVVTLDSMKGEEKEVIITFDDGEMNNFDEAFELLREFDYLAYFFIVADRIDRRGYIGEIQLLTMKLPGMLFGSHGLTHQILTEMPDERLKRELVESKKMIETILESTIDTISIPRGFCNNKVIDEAHRAGYKTVFVSQKNSAVTSPCLERIAVKSNWTLERFVQALNGETPLSEQRTERWKAVVKSMFGDRGYNHIRKFLVRKK